MYISTQVHLLTKSLQLHHLHKGTTSLSTTIDMLYSGEMQVLVIEVVHVMIDYYEYLGVNFEHPHEWSAKN